MKLRRRRRRWPLFDEGLDIGPLRHAVAASRWGRRLLALLNIEASTKFGGDGAYVVTSALSVGSATGRVALGASVADGVIAVVVRAALEAVRVVLLVRFRWC